MTGTRTRAARAALTVLLTLGAAPACQRAPQPPPAAATALVAPAPTPKPAGIVPVTASDADFTPVAQLLNGAIAAHRLPGAVVQIGHAGKVVFRQAFGSRKLAGQPGLDGSLTPAEPMTEDTLFDLASLTKGFATTPALLQLSEQGRVDIDAPLQTYLPDFNPAGDPRRSQVTVRMLLTHTSGIAGDLSLDAPWGLDPADKAEGVHRALGAWVVFDPGELFHYSDINFILVGAIIEKLTGQDLDAYVPANVFAPLGLSDTRYLPAAKACGPHRIRGAALVLDPKAAQLEPCPAGTWSTELLSRVAPTARDNDNTVDPAKNPDFGELIRGTVHDPTARRMGGVAGSAGVFSTVDDVGRYAQGLLDRRAGRPSAFPLTRASVELMTTPQQPGHSAAQLDAANKAAELAIANTPNTADPLLARHYPAIVGQDLRGFGWDIDTEQSRPRGLLFPIGSFGHTGFTGVTLWMDPGSDTYVVVLANVIHQPGGPPIAGLSGEVATATARALGLYGS